VPSCHVDRCRSALAKLIDQPPYPDPPDPSGDVAVTAKLACASPDRHERILNSKIDRVGVLATRLKSTGQPSSVTFVEQLERQAVAGDKPRNECVIFGPLPVGWMLVGLAHLETHHSVASSRPNGSRCAVNRWWAPSRQIDMNTSLEIQSAWPPPTQPGVAGFETPPPLHMRRSGRMRSAINVIVVVALIVVSSVLDRTVLLGVALLFVIVVPFEKLFPRHRGQRVRRPGAGTDVAYALAAPALNIATVAVAIVVGVATMAWLPGLAIRPLVAMIPPELSAFVGIVLFDLASYWVHRWAHEVPLLWRFHAIHHSPEQMDWVSGFRNHPAEGAILAPPFFLLIAAGFDGAVVGVLVIVQVLLGLVLHANVRWRLRPLDRLFVTPEFHHWHHSNEVAAHRTNYSIFLPVWDIIFGTYRMPRGERPLLYGVDEQIPRGMVAQLWWPVRSVGNPIRWVASTVRHPVRTVRRAARLTGQVYRDIWRSTRRPTRRLVVRASRSDVRN
jgi:sterol desaturase/sphingolipid hydroxylase (fatty acid hydroxylase superfamily)